MALDTLLKLLTALLTPLGLALGLALLGLALQRRSLVLVLAAVLWLWIWSMPKAADWLGDTLESQHPILPIAALPAADAILVLGGGSSAPVPPWMPEANLSAAADRYVFAAKLWHAHKAPLVFFSGGSGDDLKPEAETAQELFLLMGIPADAILSEGRSRTTRQNASFSVPLLRARGVQRVLVVSSVWHLPRVLLNLRAIAPEIDWIAAGCDPHEVAEATYPGSRWLPDTAALHSSRIMFKEWLGIAWTKIGGD